MNINSTPNGGGSVLGILKPLWLKALESEMRISFLKNMLERDLVLRDILKFGQIIEEKMRAESSKEEELGRKYLVDLMRVKLTDEKRYYRESKKIRESIRDFVRKKVGRRKYGILMEKIKQTLEKRRTELAEKYRRKVEHLAAQREIERREKLSIVPSGLERYKDCDIFDKEKMRSVKPQQIVHKLIGKVEISDDERKVLDLNPKFAVMRKLEQIDMEQDVELGLAKIRYEITRINKKIRDNEEEETNYGLRRERKRMRIEERDEEDEREIMEHAKSRQIFDPLTYRFNYTKKCATDLQENKSVTLPKGVEERLESEMSMLKELMMREFNRYKRELEAKDIRDNVEERKRKNQQWRNLTWCEKRGLRSLKKRIENKELICVKTDKSKKLTYEKR